MSSSPSICASPNFTFPKDQDYFALGSSHDYFGSFQPKDDPRPNHRPTLSGATVVGLSTTSQLPKVKTHGAANESISSLGSDATACDDFSFRKRPDITFSTDTLVEETSPTNKNHLNLKLTVPRHRYNQSLSASLTNTLSEDLWTLALAKEPDFPEMAKFCPPSLRKQHTLPTLKVQHELTYESIKAEQLKRLSFSPHHQTYRRNIEELLPRIRFISDDELAGLIANTRYDPQTNLPDFLMIDIRPFADYIKSHVADAINVSVPSTLLKRQNFNLRRCINSLPDYNRLIFHNYIKINDDNTAQGVRVESTGISGGTHGLPAIFIYENQNDSANLYHMCKKLIDTSCWSQESQPPIYLLDNSFSGFAGAKPHLLQSGNSERIKLDDLQIQTLSPQPLAPSVPHLSTKLRSVSLGDVSIPQSNCSTPILSNFKLPSANSQFRIRHNEELIEEEPASAFELRNYDPHQALPRWIEGTVACQCSIAQEFAKLERFEKSRLNLAFGLASRVHVLSPGGTTTECLPHILCGVDYGHKNRYKDIFVFDHLRVKLEPGVSPDKDYINASYLEPPTHVLLQLGSGQGLRYIATQGPLDDTRGDFWKCVVNHRTPVVMSLTDAFEDGVMKCSPFWLPGEYRSNDTHIKVDIVATHSTKLSSTKDNLIFRHFRVSMDDVVHHVMQIHLLEWPDMSVLTPRDLISVVMLKRYILSKSANVEWLLVAHCSAGCGRTGTFCTVDTLINLMEDNGLVDFKYNPVYDVVNNLRRQRISMVQTMRQYYLIYDTLLVYMKLRQTSHMDEKLCELPIVQEFLK